MTGPMSGCVLTSVGPTLIARAASTNEGNKSIGGCADGERGRARHAAFAGTTEGGGRESFDGARDVGVGHDDDVVFRSAIGLDAFAVAGAGFENVFRDRRRADEGNGAHFRMSEKRVDAFASAMHDVEHAFRQAGFFEQLDEVVGGQRDFLARLEDEGVSAGESEREHPHRDHGGEVEGRDADTHA